MRSTRAVHPEMLYENIRTPKPQHTFGPRLHLVRKPEYTANRVRSIGEYLATARLPSDFMQRVHALGEATTNDAITQTALLQKQQYVAVRPYQTTLYTKYSRHSQSCYAVQTWTEKRTKWTITLFGFGLSIPHAFPSPKNFGPTALLILPEAPRSECSPLSNIPLSRVETIWE